MKNKLTIVSLFCLALTGCIDYSDGDRAGAITKFSHKGFFCKTWEGTMNLGGMKQITVSSDDGKSTTNQMVPNTFDFTVEDPAIVPQVEAAMEKGGTVTLHYRQEAFVWPCRGSTTYFITGVK